MQESRPHSAKLWSLLNLGRIKASFRKYGCGTLLVLLAMLGSQAFRATPEAMPAAAPPRTEVPAASRHSTLNAGLFQNFVALSGSRMYPRLSREIVESAIKYSEKYDLSPILVLAVAKTESEFYPFALSNKNAKGLMQINPEANQRLLLEEGIFKEPADIFDPERSIEAGAFSCGASSMNLPISMPRWTNISARSQSLTRRRSTARSGENPPDRNHRRSQQDVPPQDRMPGKSGS